MLAQLKTVVLIKEAIKLAFFRLVEYLEHQHLWVRLQAQNGQKQITSFWNLSVYSCSEKGRLFHARNSQETYNAVYYSLHRTAQTGSNQNRKRVLFNEAASWGLVRHPFLKLEFQFQTKVLCFWQFWACNRTNKCWCSRYSTSLKKDNFIDSLIRTTVFSCANIIAKGFSNV